jgi:hypothetical protein
MQNPSEWTTMILNDLMPGSPTVKHRLSDNSKQPVNKDVLLPPISRLNTRA